MDAAATLREARRRAGISQAQLALETGTSQTAISAYENGRKQPSIETLSRLLAATGAQLSVKPLAAATHRPSASQRNRIARTLLDVLALAEALPVIHEPELRYPRLDGHDGAG